MTWKMKASIIDDESQGPTIRLPNLPDEIIEDILSRLPVKPLMKFKCVSKPWRALLTDDTVFIKKHLNRMKQEDGNHGLILQFWYTNRAPWINKYYFIPDENFEKAIKLDDSYIKTFDTLHYKSGFATSLQIVGSSNGLICLWHAFSTKHCGIYLWNPATREFKKLPHPHIQKQNFAHGYVSIAFGFGFDHTIDDYKVVRLVHFTDDDGVDVLNGWAEVEIYSLCTNSWRRLGAFPYYLFDNFSKTNTNGVIQWMARRTTSPVIHKLILAFDITNEMFQELPIPDSILQNHVRIIHLGMHIGSFYMFVMTSNQSIDVWLMKEYGVKDSWAKSYNIKQKILFPLMTERQILFPFMIDFFKNGNVRLWKPYGKFYSYNLESQSFQQLQIPADKESVTDSVAYVPSLVSLSNVGGEEHVKDVPPMVDFEVASHVNRK